MRTIFMTAVYTAMAAACVVAAESTKDTLDTVKKSLTEKKAILIDVREQEKWNKGHLDQAVHLPLSRITQGLTEDELNKLVPKDAVIYLHCAAGARCLKATDLLAKYPRDYRPLKPGYRELWQAGFPAAKP